MLFFLPHCFQDEAKIWRQIHAKLASLPQTIDDVCMPLVKRINNGQLYTNLDKKDAIFRQNHSTIAPFQVCFGNSTPLYVYLPVRFSACSRVCLSIPLCFKINKCTPISPLPLAVFVCHFAFSSLCCFLKVEQINPKERTNVQAKKKCANGSQANKEDV